MLCIGAKLPVRKLKSNFFSETRFFPLPTSKFPLQAKRRGLLKIIFSKKAEQCLENRQLEELNLERVVQQPHLKSRPEKGWEGEAQKL